MKLVKALHPNQLTNVHGLYQEAFPPEEQKPFSLILEKHQQGSVEILSAENERQEFMGLAITAQYQDLVLLDYFAISPDQRRGGIGSKVFQLLKDRYAGKRFFLEIESTAVKSENAEQRSKRKAFYLKNGMISLPFSVNLLGVEMELLANCCSLDFSEYHNMYRQIFGSEISKKILLKKLG